MTDTQCMIAVQEKDNTVSAVLLEHGGELAQAGKTLLDSYQDYEQVLDLVNLGDLKTLGQTPASSHSYWRDSHEDDKIIETYADTEVFDRATEDQGDYVEYCYLYCKYEGNFQWLVRDFKTGDKRFKSMANALKH